MFIDLLRPVGKMMWLIVVRMMTSNYVNIIFLNYTDLYREQLRPIYIFISDAQCSMLLALCYF